MTLGVLSSGDVETGTITLSDTPLDTAPMFTDGSNQPCYPVSFMGPIPPGASVCPASYTEPMPCYPPTFTGPLPPGASYCAPVGVASGCPAGSTCSIIAGVPNVAIFTMLGIVGALVFLGGKK